MSNYLVTFQGVNLEDRVPGLKIVKTDPYRPPNRKLTSSQIARNDLSTVSSAVYTDKKSNVTVEIGRNDRDTLEASIDTLKQVLQTIEGTLVFKQGTINRQYVATLSNMAIDEPKGGHTTIDIEFFCSDPMGYDTSATTLYNYAHLVGGLYDFLCNFQGSAELQLPVITVTINTVSAGTDGTISIMNQSKGQTLEITRDWIPTDVLIVDCLNQSVTVNGDEVEFDGPIPDWNLGSSNITYTDDFSARNIALSIAYSKRYL